MIRREQASVADPPVWIQSGDYLVLYEVIALDRLLIEGDTQSRSLGHAHVTIVLDGEMLARGDIRLRSEGVEIGGHLNVGLVAVADDALATFAAAAICRMPVNPLSV